MLKRNGFTLIELIIFIVVLSIVGLTILAAFNIALVHSPVVEDNSRAVALAEQCMDYVLGQRETIGFAAIGNPCGSPVCSADVSCTVTNSWDGNANYKVITVTANGVTGVTLTGMVANY